MGDSDSSQEDEGDDVEDGAATAAPPAAKGGKPKAKRPPRPVRDYDSAQYRNSDRTVCKHALALRIYRVGVQHKNAVWSDNEHRTCEGPQLYPYPPHKHMVPPTGENAHYVMATARKGLLVPSARGGASDVSGCRFDEQEARPPLIVAPGASAAEVLRNAELASLFNEMDTLNRQMRSLRVAAPTASTSTITRHRQAIEQVNKTAAELVSETRSAALQKQAHYRRSKDSEAAYHANTRSHVPPVLRPVGPKLTFPTKQDNKKHRHWVGASGAAGTGEDSSDEGADAHGPARLPLGPPATRHKSGHQQRLPKSAGQGDGKSTESAPSTSGTDNNHDSTAMDVL